MNNMNNFSFPVVSKKLKHEVYLINVDNPAIIDCSEVFAINGYDFADRLLEDVYFYARLSEDRKTIEVFNSSDNRYLEELNASKWSKQALKNIINTIDNESSVLILKSAPTTYIEILSEDVAKESYPDLFKSLAKKK
jgi:myosin-crossreactive antigen